MKRMAILAAVLVLCIALFAACAPINPNGPDDPNQNKPEADAVELVSSLYGTIAQAVKLQQSVVVTSGKITQYESHRTYTAQQGGYAVQGSTRRLNDLSADTAYTTTEINEQVEKAEYVGSIMFNKGFYDSYKLEDNTFTAVIKDGKAGDALGVDISQAVFNVNFEVKLSANKVSSVSISYVTGQSNVAIQITFEY